MSRRQHTRGPGLVLELDRALPASLASQVADAIRRRILDGHLPQATRLPASRALARELGVGRNTVLSAYEQLTEEGWLDAAVGRGTFVAAREETPPATGSGRPRVPRSAFPWGPLVARSVPQGRVAPRPAPDAAIDLSGGVPDASTYPAGAVRRALDGVLARHGGEALGYGPPAGYAPLREHIATRSSRQGSPVRPDEVLVVGGLQQGLDLLARVLLAPGDTVAVESPTYGNALAIWRLYGARPVGVSVDDRGMSPEALAAVVRQHRPKFVYTMPTFQNPTGLTMDEERRREIMRVASEMQLAVVEDHFDTELRYRGRALPPLRAHDPRGQVVLLGTFSKILFPGFRLGWIIAPRELLGRLLDVKRATELATSLPMQMAVAEFCKRGELDRHLDRVRRAHGARLDAMLEAIDACFPPGVRVTRPEGGMFVWVTLPEGAHASTIAEVAAGRGLLVAEGRLFAADGDGERHLRLSFVNEPAERIRRGIEQLGEIIAGHLDERGPVRRGPDESAPFL